MKKTITLLLFYSLFLKVGNAANLLLIDTVKVKRYNIANNQQPQEKKTIVTNFVGDTSFVELPKAVKHTDQPVKNVIGDTYNLVSKTTNGDKTVYKYVRDKRATVEAPKSWNTDAPKPVEAPKKVLQVEPAPTLPETQSVGLRIETEQEEEPKVEKKVEVSKPIEAKKQPVVVKTEPIKVAPAPVVSVKKEQPKEVVKPFVSSEKEQEPKKIEPVVVKIKEEPKPVVKAVKEEPVVEKVELKKQPVVVKTAPVKVEPVPAPEIVVEKESPAQPEVRIERSVVREKTVPVRVVPQETGEETKPQPKKYKEEKKVIITEEETVTPQPEEVVVRRAIKEMPKTEVKKVMFTNLNNDSLFVVREPNRKPEKQKFETTREIDVRALRNSFDLDVCYAKTTHLIFPSNVKYVDLGSADIIAEKVTGIDNLLRVKANVKGFDETNLTAVTADGKFYSFMVHYREVPTYYNVNLNYETAMANTGTLADVIEHAPTGRREDLVKFSGTRMTETNIIKYSKKVYDKRRETKHLGIEKYKMGLTLQGIYTADDLFFYKFRIQNTSDISYDIDFMRIYIRDKDLFKRTTQQEIEVLPIYVYNNASMTVERASEIKKVYVLPKFTIPEGKVIEVELYEKNGGRHLRFQIENDDILNTQYLK